MDKSIAMKHEVLEMLKNFMMGEQGKKIKPKAIEVSMVTEKPKGGLNSVLEKASHEKDEFEDSPADNAMDSAMAKKAGMSKDEWEDSPEDEEADCEATKKTSLKEFFKRK